MKTYAKFAALVVVILGTLGWLATSGVKQTESYYKEIKDINTMGQQAQGKRLRVGGYVEKGSIVRTGKDVAFTLQQDALTLRVVYSGIDPLPDTFKDGAQALADGRLGPDGVFQANKIQAKCASKYEAKPMMKKDANQAGM
jgi:cytochrome c-type biogenesis protein CcmE